MDASFRWHDEGGGARENYPQDFVVRVGFGH
jgi:hypothetical protein